MFRSAGYTEDMWLPWDAFFLRQEDVDMSPVDLADSSGEGGGHACPDLNQNAPSRRCHAMTR